MPREAWRASGPGSLTAYRCLWLQAYWDAISLLVKRGWAAMMSQCLWVLRNWESLRILDKMLDRHLDLYEQFCQHSAVSLLGCFLSTKGYGRWEGKRFVNKQHSQFCVHNALYYKVKHVRKKGFLWKKRKKENLRYLFLHP